MNHHAAPGVVINDPLWSGYRKLVKEVILPYQWEVMNDRVAGVAKSHAIANLRIAGGHEDGEFHGFRFQDSDVAKWLEAVAYNLASKPDEALEELADQVIDLIADAQQPDGYLNTFITLTQPDQRWKNERENHETYVAGHLIEAAVAYYQATGKRRFLDVMIKNADHIDRVYGPEEGKLRGYPGHPELELALVRLYEVTGNPKYLRLATYFVDERGRQPNYFVEEAKARGEPEDLGRFKAKMFEYNLSHLPVREQERATGHAVRAVYLYSAMADLAAFNKDTTLTGACKKLWRDVTRGQMHITGGIGQQEFWEGFSQAYDLPNATSYNETCASIGLVFWARRMARLELSGDYFDVAEQALYNGVLSGMSLDGRKYFYINLLESIPRLIPSRKDTEYASPTRQGWFPCACCPPNLARLISSIGDYIYTLDGDSLTIQLFIASAGEFTIKGIRVRFAMEGNYPDSGNIRLTISPDQAIPFSIRIRIPAWGSSGYRVTVTGNQSGSEAPTAATLEPNLVEQGYLRIEREWSEGDVIHLTLPMVPRLMQANPEVTADAGRVAIMRGPVVYCLEEIDNGPRLSDIALDYAVTLEERFEPDLLGGVTAIYAMALRGADDWSEGQLYREARPRTRPRTRPVRIKAVPYRVWDNRGENEMLVWIRAVSWGRGR